MDSLIALTVAAWISFPLAWFISRLCLNGLFQVLFVKTRH
jgi:hypothetical protein